MQFLTKDVQFDPSNGDLWINVVMIGLLRMDYQWDMYSKNSSEPFVLTSRSRAGNNSTPHNDFYPLKSDYNPAEPVGDMANRYCGLMMGIIGNPGDSYQFSIEVKQGADYPSSTLLDSLGTPPNQIVPPGVNYLSYKCEINFYSKKTETPDRTSDANTDKKADSVK